MKKSQVDEILKYAKKKYGTEPEYLWLSDPDSGVLRHSDNNKWYGIVMKVPETKLGLNNDEIIDILNVKCNPDFIISGLMPDGFCPGYHMNKKHWITIPLDGSIQLSTIYPFIDMSFELTASKKKK